MLETYVGRTVDEHVVGKIVPFSDCICIARNGREQHISRLQEPGGAAVYEVLTFQPPDARQPADVSLDWIEARGNEIPAGAVEGGLENGVVTYIGRRNAESQKLCGKVNSNEGCLIVTWNGRELRYTDYELLVLKDVDKYTLNDVMYDMSQVKKIPSGEMVTVSSHAIRNDEVNDREVAQEVYCSREDSHSWTQAESKGCGILKGIVTDVNASCPVITTKGTLDELSEGTHSQLWDDKVTIVRTNRLLIKYFVPTKHTVSAGIVVTDMDVEIPYTGALIKYYKNGVQPDSSVVRGVYKGVLKQIDIRYGDCIPLSHNDPATTPTDRDVTENRYVADNTLSTPILSLPSGSVSNRCDASVDSSKETGSLGGFNDKVNDKQESTNKETEQRYADPARRDCNSTVDSGENALLATDVETAATTGNASKLLENDNINELVGIVIGIENQAGEDDDQRLQVNGEMADQDTTVGSQQTEKMDVNILTNDSSGKSTQATVNSQTTNIWNSSTISSTEADAIIYPPTGDQKTVIPSPASTRQVSVIPASSCDKSENLNQTNPFGMLHSHAKESNTNVQEGQTNGKHPVETDIDADIIGEEDSRFPAPLQSSKNSGYDTSPNPPSEEPLMGSHESYSKVNNFDGTQKEDVSSRCCDSGCCTVL